MALSCSVPCSHMGGRQTLSQESYFKSLCWTSSQALTRLSSMYIRKRMRSPQARLLVSCFRRLGLDLPLKPAERESYCDSLGKLSCIKAQQPTWLHHLCVLPLSVSRSGLRPGTRVTQKLHPDTVQRPSWTEDPTGRQFLCSEFPPLSSWGYEIENTFGLGKCASPDGAALEAPAGPQQGPMNRARHAAARLLSRRLV